MQFIIFFLLAGIVLAVFSRSKVQTSANKTSMFSALLILIIAVPAYFIFGQPNYNNSDKKASVSFESASPEQNAVLRTFEVLKSEDSQLLSQWQDVAVALRLQRAFTESSAAYENAAKLVDITEEKASFYGAAGEVLVERDSGNVSEEAASMFRKALEHDQSTLGGHYYLGVFNEVAGNERVALRHYRNFLVYAGQNHPRTTDVNTKIFALSGEITAPESAKIAPVLSPEMIDEFQSLPEAEQAEFLQAMILRRFNKLEQQGASAEEWRDLARIFQRMGNKEQALKAYDWAVKTSPDNEALQLERSLLETK